MQSKLLAVFPEKQLKELKEAEVTVLMEEVDKLELRGDTVEGVDREIFDEKNYSSKQSLNSSFDCLHFINLEARLSIFGSFKQFLLKLN